jgi:hypothetical protein
LFAGNVGIAAPRSTSDYSLGRDRSSFGRHRVAAREARHAIHYPGERHRRLGGGRAAGREPAERDGRLPRGAGPRGRAGRCERLHPTSKGWRIEWSGGRKIVTDGPFAETKELIAGYTIINVASREEAIAWAGRYPNPALGDGAIEVRQIFNLEDFGDIPGIERFRQLEATDSNN